MLAPDVCHADPVKVRIVFPKSRHTVCPYTTNTFFHLSQTLETHARNGLFKSLLLFVKIPTAMRFFRAKTPLFESCQLAAAGLLKSLRTEDALVGAAAIAIAAYACLRLYSAVA